MPPAWTSQLISQEGRFPHCQTDHPASSYDLRDSFPESMWEEGFCEDDDAVAKVDGLVRKSLFPPLTLGVAMRAAAAVIKRTQTTDFGASGLVFTATYL